MNRRFGYFLSILIFPLAAHAQTQSPAQLKCGASDDRIWVYDSFTTLNLEAKLKCDETVEIVSRVQGYVKIKSSNGTVGYVPDSTFPDLPPLPSENDATAAGASALVRAASKRTVASATPTPQPTTTVIPSAATQEPAHETASEKAPAVTAAVIQTPNTSAPSQAAVAPNQKSDRATNAPAPVSTKSPQLASLPADHVAVQTTKSSQPVSLRPADTAGATASDVAVQTIADEASAPTKRTTLSLASMSTAKPQPAASKTVHYTSAPTSAPSMPATTELAMDVSPAIALAKPAAKRESVEDEDYPDAQPEDESADSACRVYFSAYGLSPAQFKWLAANRKKQYPTICPAPNLGSVDVVMLFTHDSDTYSGAMPEPVHTDHSGFSDFNPMTTADSALVSGADADKARREYVWVFQMTRGAFDPTKFSLRRRPQFTTVESKGGARALEDAFSYVEGRSATQIAANR